MRSKAGGASRFGHDRADVLGVVTKTRRGLPDYCGLVRQWCVLVGPRLQPKRLGELYEERNDRDKAVEYYNELVELWKDADPELQPQVEDVRGRIARLEGEGRR